MVYKITNLSGRTLVEIEIEFLGCGLKHESYVLDAIFYKEYKK